MSWGTFLSLWETCPSSPVKPFFQTVFSNECWQMIKTEDFQPMALRTLKYIISAQLNGVCNLLLKLSWHQWLQGSKCDSVGFFVWFVVFYFIRASEKIHGTTRGATESDKALNLRVWATGPYKSKVFVGIKTKGYSAWKLRSLSITA